MKMGGERIRKLCGDGLQVQLDSNDSILEVTGDGCKITMTKNCGQVRVVGDGCHLKIAHNIGNIEYTGDGGQVQLGPKSSKDNVRYIGDGGKVTFDFDTSAKRDKTRNHRASPTNLMTNEKAKDITPEEQQNFINEQKEGEQRNHGRKSGNSSPKTRIITTFDCDGHEVVKKWFINPSSVIKSFDGGHSTCRRAKMNL